MSAFLPEPWFFVHKPIKKVENLLRTTGIFIINISLIQLLEFFFWKSFLFQSTVNPPYPYVAIGSSQNSAFT